MFFIALLMRTIQVPEQYQAAYRTGGVITVVVSAIILLIGFTGLDTIPLLIIVIIAMLTPIFYAVKVWVETMSAEEEI